MLQLNSDAAPSELLFVRFPHNAQVESLNQYPMTLTNVVSQEVVTTTSTYIVGTKNRRGLFVRFETVNLPLGMYIAVFKDLKLDVLLEALCFASPGGNSPSPGTPSYATNTESITVYYE